MTKFLLRLIVTWLTVVQFWRLLTVFWRPVNADTNSRVDNVLSSSRCLNQGFIYRDEVREESHLHFVRDAIGEGPETALSNGRSTYHGIRLLHSPWLMVLLIS